MNKKFYFIGGLVMLVALGVAYVVTGGGMPDDDQASPPTEQAQPSQGIRIN